MNNDSVRIRHSKRAMAPFAFLLPAAAVAVIALICGIYPFGNATLLCDANRDFINGLETFGSTSASSAMFSFSRGLGSGQWSVLTSMFSNPLCMLGFLFPQGKAADAFLLITMLKMSFAGLFCYFMTSAVNDRPEICLGLSTAYGGCAGFLIGSFMPSVMDAFVFLPAVAAGIVSLVRRGRVGVLFLSLSAVMITSWQLIPAILLFTVGFFAWSTVAGEGEERGENTAVNLLLCVIFAVGAASMVIIPSIMERSELGNAVRAMNDVPTVGITRLLSGLFMGDKLQSGSSAVLFCSAFTLLILPVYVFNSEMPKSERVLGAGMLVLLLIAQCLNALGIMFTVFKLPEAYECGTSFVFCAFAAACAARGLSRPGGITVGKAVGSWFFAGGLFVISIAFGKISNITLIIFTFAFLTLYAAIALVVMSSRQTPAIFGIIVMVCIFAECCSSGVFRVNQLKGDRLLAIREVYAEASGSEQSINAMISGREKGEGRAGVSRVRGETALLSPTDLVNENCADIDQPPLYAMLGIKGNKGWTELTDSLFAVRYLLSDKDDSPYPLISSAQGTYISENPNALSIGMASSDIITGIDMTKCSTPFTAQELLVSAIAGRQMTLFVPLEAEMNAQGANFVSSGGGVFITRFSGSAYLTCTMTATTNGRVYMWLSSTLPDDAAVTVNGSRLQGSDLSALVKLGHFSAGERIEVDIPIIGVSESLNVVQFAALDDVALADTLKYLSSRQLTYSKYDGNTLSGVVDISDGELLLTTIPYSKGWTAYSDGGEVETTECTQGLMGVYVPSGQHTVSLVYQPRGFTVCASASLLFLMAGVAWAVATARKNRKYEQPEQYAYGDIPDVEELEPLSEDFVLPVSNVELEVDLDYDSEENTLDWL